MQDKLSAIGTDALDRVKEIMAGEKKEEIYEEAFQSALAGIRSGEMTYQGDPLLPLLTKEIEERTEALMNLTP